MPHQFVAEHFPALTVNEPDLRQPRRDRWREVPVRYEVDLADALALHRQLHGGERVLGPLVEHLEQADVRSRFSG